MDQLNDIRTIANEIEKSVIDARRNFHKYPELAWLEIRTASLIARKLKDIGCDIKIGREIIDAESRVGLPNKADLSKELERALAEGADKEFAEPVSDGFTGVAAVISNGEGPVIGLRVDTDALRVTETSASSHQPLKEGFTSTRDGVMHACGHDANTAVGLGVAEVLTRLKDNIRGTVKIIFQPAEESIAGAYPIAQSGFLDDIDKIFSIHYFSPWNSGEVTCARDPGYFAISRFDVRFKGESSHAGGQPEKGRNALLAAANAVTNLYAIPRNGQGGTRINVGTLSAGSDRNVICDDAFMRMETRGATTELNEYMTENAMRVLKASAELWNCELEVIPMGGAPGGGSDDVFADFIMNYAEKTGILKARHEQRSFGSEDFICMLKRVREHGGEGAALSIGAGPAGKHHGPDFDLNESVLKDSVIFASGLILEILKE
ncbi:MAG: amidohydrolase [Victivallales bacterium]|nr:amidohydrolase [Victivallales bacterium]